MSWVSRVAEALRDSDLSSATGVDAAIHNCRNASCDNVLFIADHTPTRLHSLHAACEAFHAAQGVVVYATLIPLVRDAALRILSADNDATLLPPSLHDSGTVSVPLPRCRELLALSFFCVHPTEEQAFARIDLHTLFRVQSEPVAQARILCLLEYFNRCFNVLGEGHPALAGKLDITRRRLGATSHYTSPDWSACDVTLSADGVRLSEDRIEDAQGADAHVDFANKRLHIGRVIPSATQEEVLFSIRPDLFIAMLVVGGASMQDDEVVIISGARRFSCYKGYLRTFRYTGPVIELESKPPAIVAIDAIVVKGYNTQFKESHNMRDLSKCWLGFVDAREHNAGSTSVSQWTVSTGLWGCGAFGGDPVLKFIQQFAAAAAAGTTLVFSCYGNPPLRTRLNRMHALLVGHRVSNVLRIVSDYSEFCKARHSSGGQGELDVISAVADRLGSGHKKAAESWEKASELEESGDTEKSVSLYSEAFRLWPELDSRVVRGVPIAVMNQFARLIGLNRDTTEKTASASSVAPYLTGSVDEMELRASELPASDFEAFALSRLQKRCNFCKSVL